MYPTLSQSLQSQEESALIGLVYMPCSGPGAKVNLLPSIVYEMGVREFTKGNLE